MNSIQHVAIIMDGNGRWAEQRGLPRWKGHEMGAHSVRRVLEEACRQEIPFLTLFAFSSENWKRPSKEVQILFRLFLRYLVSERSSLLKNGIRLEALGRRDRLPLPVREALSAVEDATRHCRCLHLRLAVDYGSRHETGGDYRGAVFERAVQEFRPRSRSDYPNRGGAKTFQFSSLAGCLFRILFLPETVAGFQGKRFCRGAGRLPIAHAQIWRTGLRDRYREITRKIYCVRFLGSSIRGCWLVTCNLGP
jgi:hypothetical protein